MGLTGGNMIKNSFIFIPGIGEKTEEYFWRKGILTWDDLEESAYHISPNKTKRRIIEDYLEKAKDSLNKKHSFFFADHLPQKEYWRLYKDFRTKTLFLDIETTGLSLYYDVITLIGTFDGYNIKIFVKDNNLSGIVDYLKDYEILVSFNGKLFDIPFIKKEFPMVPIPPIHIDLRFLLRSLGITGPLKEVEKRVGIEREKDVQEINGREAAVLWSRFVKGDDESLKRLVLYNIYDTINLEKLMHFCYLKKIETMILPKMTHNHRQKELFEIPERKEFAHYLTSSNVSVPQITMRQYNYLSEIQADGQTLLKVNRNRIKSIKIKTNSLIQKVESRGYKALSVGIDLSGSENKVSGICTLRRNEAYLSMAKTDKEIISKVIEEKPVIISIDSPLSLPKGRCCANDSCECRKYGITRECERILKKRGINVYPCLIKSMQKLTMRGIRFSQIFEEHGYQVIESYPGAAQDILRFPRKRVNLKELEIDLMNMGIKPFANEDTITHDEIDALTSALVGYFYLAGMYEAIGEIEEGYLIIPDIKNGGE